MAGSVKKASLIVAASMGAVEALKDQAGLCRWNYALRSLYQRAQATRIASSSIARPRGEDYKTTTNAFSGRAKRSEESLQKAYHLICWGPN